MQAGSEINLLIALENVDHANQLINVLRNASYSVHSTVLDADTELSDVLKQEPWDLALLEFENQTVEARSVLLAFKKHQLDIPVIIMATSSEGNPYVEGLRMGADYVVPMDEDQYFLLAVANSLAHLEQRRKKDFWKNLCLKAESRCDNLMGNSKDAIAIIQDGTFVFVNEAYSALFGYPDVDDMLLLPVIDTIEETSHSVIKPYLRPLEKDASIDDTILEVSGITPDAKTIDATINISSVLYESESALQFLVSHERLAATNMKEPGLTSTPENLSDIEPKKIIATIDQAILKAVRTEEQSLMVYIRADQLQEFSLSSGVASAEQLLSSLQEYIQEKTPLGQSILKFSEDTLVTIVDINTADEGQKYAENLYKDIATHTFSVGEESIVLSLNIGLSALVHSNQTAVECLKQCRQAITSRDASLEESNTGNPNIFYFGNEALDRFESEKSVVDFGHLLLEKRLIGIEFQPVAALQGEVAEYYEVLMRPKVDDYPYSVPEDFIDRVFKTRVAGDIDRWVILEAIKALSEKIKRDPETKLFVNLSAASIQDSSFAAWLNIALQTAQIPPSHLVLLLREIDVGRFIKQSEKLIQQVSQLQTQTALTHFGLTINPLLVLDRLKVDFIKVDKLLVQGAIKGGDAAKHLEVMLESLASLSPQVVIPYVENPSIMPMLWKNGVAYIQGFYVQKPMPVMDYDFVESS